MKASKLLSRFLVCMGLGCVGVGCGSGEQGNDREISGTLLGLPDGMMYLRNINFINIDSCPTVGGKFKFRLVSQKFPEPSSATIFHLSDEDSTLRFFQFPRTPKTKGQLVRWGRFMLDQEGITMNGTIKDSFFESKRASSTIDGEVKFGKQTHFMLDDTLKLNGSIKLDDMRKVILANPSSYHMLYNVKGILHSLNTKQAMFLLNCFDKDVLASNTALEIKNYVTSRGEMRLYNTSLTDSAGKQHYILNKNARLNMVVLWASWCAPCLEEIPQLKELYQKFGADKNFNMVSVSLDLDKAKWKKRLDVEKMPWKQLLTEESQFDYYKEIFGVNSAIPTILLYGRNGKLLKKYTGYSPENKNEMINLLASNLK